MEQSIDGYQAPGQSAMLEDSGHFLHSHKGHTFRLSQYLPTADTVPTADRISSNR